MPLSARRLSLVLSTSRYPAIRSALLARFTRTDLDAWAAGQTPSPANRLVLNNMSGNFITRDGWDAPRREVA